jgi:hypothetical protein
MMAGTCVAVGEGICCVPPLVVRGSAGHSGSVSSIVQAVQTSRAPQDGSVYRVARRAGGSAGFSDGRKARGGMLPRDTP